MVNDSNIITINSTESKMKINKFSGNYRQATRSGKNKLLCTENNYTKNGVTVTNTGNKITVKGTATAGFSIFIYSKDDNLGKLDVELNKTYIETVITDGTFTGNVELNIANSASNYYSQVRPQSNQTKSVEKLYDSEITRIFLWISDGATLDCTFSIQIEEGTEFTSFEEYGVSPSIDYPSEIEAVGDNINYFNKDSATQGKYLNYQNQEIENSAWTYSDYIPCKPNENWIISGYNTIGGASSRCFYDKNKSFLSGGAHNNQESMMKFTTPNNCYFFRESLAKADIDTVKIEKSEEATAYSPYNQGSIEIKKINKNWFNVPSSNSYGVDFALQDDGSYKINGTSTTAWVYRYGSYIWLAKGKYTISAEGIEGLASCIFGVRNDDGSFVKQITPASLTLTFEVLEDIKVRPYFTCSAPAVYNNNNVKVMLEKSEAKTEWAKHEEESYVLDIQKPMLQGDYFVKEDDGWKEVHKYEKVYLSELDWQISANELQEKTFNFVVMYSNSNLSSDEKNCLCNCFNSETANFVYANDVEGIAQSKSQIMIRISKNVVTGLDDFKTLLAEKNAYAYIQPQNLTKLTCTSEQITVLNELQNILLYDDTTHIMLDDVYPILDYDVSKIVDTTMTFEASLDENGYFVVPDYNIKCLVSYSESNIPTMPEAVESTVRVAGKDGDIVLGTTYEPIAFTIVCYTDDNLSIEEKNAEELKMNNFLNSIKDKTIRLKNDSKNIFYNVKYNGLLTTINYPKHLQFSIPLKTSASFANNIEKSYMLGNATKQSNTAKKVGAIFTIDGPAQTPKIYLNDYEMFYNNVILSGAKLIIDSNRSTVTMVGRDGNLTNAMRYYNHEFPKIENGENVLKVSSGIDEDRQVSVEWFDLKL